MTALLAPVLHGLIYLLGIIGLTWGGNLFCKALLQRSGLVASMVPTATSEAARESATSPQTSSPLNAVAGRFIGSLERLIIMIGLLGGSWEIIAGVIALKAVARFKEIDHRIQAEYFLVGSLASILWAILITLGLNWYDRAVGLDLLETLLPVVKP